MLQIKRTYIVLGIKHRNTQYCTIRQKYDDGLIFPPSKEVTPGVKRTMYILINILKRTKRIQKPDTRLLLE